MKSNCIDDKPSSLTRGNDGLHLVVQFLDQDCKEERGAIKKTPEKDDGNCELCLVSLVIQLYIIKNQCVVDGVRCKDNKDYKTIQ